MASKPGTSPWLEAVQRFERAIGEPVEAFVRSDAYFDLMTQTRRSRARVMRAFEQAAEEWLHLFNLPAASDIRRLREQLSRVERQLNEVAKDVADLEEERELRADKGAAKPKRKPARSRAATRRTRAPAAPKANESGSGADVSGDTPA
jgi:hypothetical protein